jgi:hypothetical protein
MQNQLSRTETEETVRHPLYDCRKYEKERRRMRWKIGRQFAQIDYVLSSRKAMPALFEFLHSTQRFKETFGDALRYRERRG